MTDQKTLSSSGRSSASGAKGPKAPRLHKADHDPRAAALMALSRVLLENADSQAALDDVLRSPTLVPTDKRLCTELVYGVLRWYLRLDQFCLLFLQKPDKLPREMRLCLLAALYEMVFLRVPHHGPVGWAVSHVRNRFGAGLAGVANGALRSMQRDLARFAQPGELLGPDASDEAVLALGHAMPVWIVRLWLDAYGREATQALLEAAQCVPPSGLRLNRAAPGWEEARAALLEKQEPVAATGVGPAGLAFAGTLPWRAKELTAQGLASRQSAASYQALESLAPAFWPAPVWDACAGRGGKTLALLEQGVNVALASDVSVARLAGLGKEYARLGLAERGAPPCPAVASFSASAAEFPAGLPERFRTVLVDAPCSGLGTLARRPEIRLRRTPADLDRLTALQRDILRAVWRRLEPGGFLAYLTCTLNPAENEDCVMDFLSAHTDALVRREWRTPVDSPLKEFFYGALLQKND